MKGNVLVVTILAVVGLSLAAWPARAQCNPDCQGDFNNDNQVTVNEIITAVNNALNGCSVPPQQGCVNSGGTVTTTSCCLQTSDFPNTCSIGACGCPPASSHMVQYCDCPANYCFDSTKAACVPMSML